MADAPDGLRQALADRYAIEREIGAGGMATVYLASDLRHDRKVALKVLKPELAAVLGAERFVVEIKTTASLQHPHILPLFDSGAAEGFLYYVMPFIDGETLRAKLDRETQLSVDEAVRIAEEVLDALEYAHQHGIVHRDIKPENILLQGGHAMVADFGIALAVSAAAGGRMTDSGISLGTPHYMSPEQATGAREISARSDVYSLGSVLYEMLAGEPPHTGGSAQQIIMKIIAEPVAPVTTVRKSVPPNVAAAVARALEKLPADRFESAKAFNEALGNPAYANQPDAGGYSGSRADGRRSFKWPFVGTSVLGAGLLVAALWGWLRRPGSAAELRVTRFEIALPPDIPARESFGSRIAIAPDGKSLVYLGITDGVRRLFIRSLDQTTARLLPGTAGASVPFFSPDSKFVGFVAGGEMKRVAASGEDAVLIAKTPGVISGASWGEDGLIVFTSLTDRGLWRVPSAGGSPALVVVADTSRGAWLTAPDFLPGRETVMYEGDQIRAVDLQSGRSQPLFPGAQAHYAGEDKVVFARPDGLYALQFDRARLRAVGKPFSLRVVPNSTGDAERSEFAVSHEGTLIYLPNQENGEGTLVLVDRQGKAIPLDREPARFRSPRFAPVGRMVAVGIERGDGQDVWVYDAGSAAAGRRLTFDGAVYPVWSLDGAMIAYLDSNGLSWTRADGSGSPRRLRSTSRGGPALLPGPWSPSGPWLIAGEGGSVSSDLWQVPIDTALPPRRLLQTPFAEMHAEISPNGRWVAYTSNESGQWEVYVRELPAMGGRFQVSLGGGLMPVWDRNGKELYYRSGNRLYSAVIAPGPAFNVTDRGVLFEAPQLRSAQLERDYDVSPDGQHFVMLQRANPLEQLVVVQNWFQELRVDK